MNENSGNGFIRRFATMVVDKRNLIFLLYIFAAISACFP